MSKTFKIPKKPYGSEIVYKKSDITLEPGFTALVGCNGSGKTTLLRLIKEQLLKENIPVFTYDNKTEGASTMISRAVLYGQMPLAGTLATSSEGEQIMVCLGEIAQQIGSFIRKNSDSDEFWIFLDAIDSGFSIDNIIEIKDFFKDCLVPDVRGKGKEVHILCSANSFEVANGENCFDVINGEYVTFKDYEEYKRFILSSRKTKDKRYKNGKKD